MTLNSFISKWLGKKADWDGFYGGQCVDLFRYYCDEVLGIKQPAGVWGAANFWTNFDTDPVLVNNFTKIENTREFIPKRGDIMVWNFNSGGGYGHISIVLEATRDRFISLDQNWPTYNKVTETGHYYKNVYGVLRPKPTQSMPENSDLEICLKQHKELVDKCNEKDNQLAEFKAELDGAKERAKSIEKTHFAFVDEVAAKAGSISDKARILEAIEMNISREEQLNNKLKAVQKAMKDLEDQKKMEIDALKSDLDRCLKQIKTLQSRLEAIESKEEENKPVSDALKGLGAKSSRFVTWIKKLFKR